MPGTLSGSAKWPTLTSREAAALSVVGSEIKVTTRPLDRVTFLYSRSSLGDLRMAMVGADMVEARGEVGLKESIKMKSRKCYYFPSKLHPPK